MREPDPHVLVVQQLFVRHQPQLRGFVLSLLPDFAGVDDVMQEVFLTVTTKAADFQPGTNFMAWAVTIARHKVFHALRRLKRPVISAATLDALAAACPEVVADDRRLKVPGSLIEHELRLGSPAGRPPRRAAWTRTSCPKASSGRRTT